MIDILALIAFQARCNEVKKQLISPWFFINQRTKEAIISANAGLIEVPELSLFLFLSSQIRLIKIELDIVSKLWLLSDYLFLLVNFWSLWYFVEDYHRFSDTFTFAINVVFLNSFKFCLDINIIVMN